MPCWSILSFGDFAPLIIIGFIVLVAAIAYLGHLQAQRRRQALAALARSMGWSFSAGKDYGMEDRFGQFSCLRQGSCRYAFNTMQGPAGRRDLCVFDYHYETHSTDSKGRRQTHHHYFSAAILDSGLPLRPLFIRPEGFFDKLTEFLGYDDIDFESDEFSRRFYVKSPDKKWAFDVIHQATMEFLLQSPTFTLDFQGRHVIAYRGSQFDVEEFRSAVAVIEGVLDRLPEYLLRELKGVD